MPNVSPVIFADIVLPDLLDAIPHPVVVVDRNLRVVAVNSRLEALTGLGQDDACGLYVDSVLRSSIGGRGRIFREVLESGRARVVEGDILGRDRRRLTMQFTLAPLHGQSDEPAGLVITLDDLSIRGAGADQDSGSADAIIGQSAKMQKVFDLIPLMARTEASVLITGETGTGKDKIAEAIHQRSSRAGKPFIKINCGALPESLLESELFGYVKGAFTGAVKDKPGMFRLAQGGTLFLTEIGDMPLPLQVKLLSVLDDQEFFPLGGEKKVQVDVRIIAATHRPLKDRVAAGLFREDLFYRLNVLHLHLPPLRERDSDTRFLVNHFLRTFAARTSGQTRTFSFAALEVLMAYPFPGNIRELRNIVEYCVNICPEREIDVEHLPSSLLGRAPQPGAAAAEISRPAEGVSPSQPNATAAVDWLTIERELIVNTLTLTRGNRSRAAVILGWGRTTLWRKLKQHGLTPETGNKGGSA
ncbi:MAG: sigma 54-interacting transcriptional regulator [Desulfobulbus sp.]|jgi:PAS domain S-box-containing protein|nr:sigma 54-interacting transcriptional regulator [Desulfobulbus sp.]